MPRHAPLLVLCSLLGARAGSLVGDATAHHGVSLSTPLASLAGFNTSLALDLPPTDPTGAPWPHKIEAAVFEWDLPHQLGSAKFDPYVSGNASLDGLALRPGIALLLTSPRAGYTRLEVQLRAASGPTPGRVLWSNSDEGAAPLELWSIAPTLSLLPALVAVVLALVLRQVLVALAVALWLGATVVYGLDPLVGALRTVDWYLADSIGGSSHPLIIVFTLLLGGIINVIRHSGGAAGLAQIATGVAKKPEHVLLVSYGLGVGVAFDDYASILITGSAMQPVAARLGVPPLRMAWVLHGVAVCACSIHPLSSWFGVQLGYISQ